MTVHTYDGLRRHVDIWCQFPHDLQDAIADCITLPYVLKSTTRERFAAERDLTVGTEEFAAAWEAYLAECRVMLKNAYLPNCIVYCIYVRLPNGTPLALGTIMWVTGTRLTPIGDAIGDPKSSLPTLRMLRFPFFPVGLGLDPLEIPESEVVEFGRIVLRPDSERQYFVEQGYIRQGDAEYLSQYGSSELRARLYFCGRELAMQPTAILCNSALPLIRSFNRKGMNYVSLAEHGAEPTTRTLEGPPLVRGAFNWTPHIAPHVPAPIMAQGMSAAIRHLIATQSTVLDNMSLSFPHIAIVDAALEEAMAALIATCGLKPLPHGLATRLRQPELATTGATR